MPSRISCAGAALLAVLCLSIGGAASEEAKSNAAFAGMWNRASKPSTWDVTKPAGPGQQAPLKPEFEKAYAENRAKQKAGQYFDPQAACKPTGMPRMMTIYDPMEIVVTPAVTYMLLEATSPIRRIFTDGRSWPQDPNPGFAGISHGTWIDTSGSGTYDRLEVETRFLKGRRIVEATGIPLAEDAEASWVLHPTPDRCQLRDVGAEHLTTPFRQRTSPSRPVHDRDFVERDLVPSEVRGQRDVVF